MIITPDTKTTGEHWDEELSLYLDVDAAVQRWAYWWDQLPMDYLRLQEKREAAGIEVDDHLFHVSDLDEPYHPEDHDE